MEQQDHGSTAIADLDEFEKLLLEQGAADAGQIERARRISARLKRPKRTAEVLVDLGQISHAEFDRLMSVHRSRLEPLQILEEEGVLDAAGLQMIEAARHKNPKQGERAIVLASGLVTEEQYLKAVAARHGIQIMDPEPALADGEVMSQASIPYLLRHHVFPIHIVDGKLTAILADPLDKGLLAELERMFSVPIRPCCATAEKITKALHAVERVRDGRTDASATALQYRVIKDDGDPARAGESAVGILDWLLVRAIQLRASDLHLEPMQAKVRVRARVDGVLRVLTELPVEFAPQITSRVKVLAGADISERRLHQDGRIFVRVEGREIDIRVSTYAGVFGETTVLRILDRRRGLVALDELGFAPKVLSEVRDIALRAATGLIVISGPTGSGKTTTLYSFVDFVNSPELKVISCEDPVEYVLEGVTQCSVNSKSGPTFTDSLKAIVRQDPDVIIVGEIRDRETAALAVESALTGHAVYSTLHTEDAVGAVIRLGDMGVEPYLLSSTLACVVAQRLVRKICSACKRAADPPRDDLRFLGLERSDLHGLPLAEGAGCPKCDGSGFRGRVGIHEVLLPDADFRDAIIGRAPSKVLREMARKLPAFVTLQESGTLAAVNGWTTLGEIAANAPRDEGMRPPLMLRDLLSVGLIA